MDHEQREHCGPKSFKFSDRNFMRSAGMRHLAASRFDFVPARGPRLRCARGPVSVRPWNIAKTPSHKSHEVGEAIPPFRLATSPRYVKAMSGVRSRAARISISVGASQQKKACSSAGPIPAPAQWANMHAVPIVTPASPGTGGPRDGAACRYRTCVRSKRLSRRMLATAFSATPPVRMSRSLPVCRIR